MDLIEQPDRADARNLFRELGESGNTRFFLPIVAAVDAGMDTAGDKGEGDDLKERDAPRVPEHGSADKGCVFPDHKAGGGRQKQRQKQSDPKIESCTCRIVLRKLGGHKT